MNLPSEEGISRHTHLRHPLTWKEKTQTLIQKQIRNWRKNSQENRTQKNPKKPLMILALEVVIIL